MHAPTSVFSRTAYRTDFDPSPLRPSKKTAPPGRGVSALVLAPLFFALLLVLPELGHAQGVEQSDEQAGPRTAPKEAASKAKKPVWLGVAISEDEKERPGARVNRVLDDSPADDAGLETGDRILEVEGRKVEDLETLKKALSRHAPGDSVSLTVRRSDENQSIDATLAPQPGHREILEMQLVGESLASFRLERLEGDDQKVGPEDFKGKPTVLEFWATWCYPCRATANTLNKLKKSFGDEVRIVGVSSEDMRTLRVYRKKAEPNYEILRDFEESAHDALLVSSYPTLVVVDAEGKVTDVFLGVGHEDALRNRLEKLTK